MTPSIWETIAETPWWVCLFIFAFIRVAYAATKPKIIHTKTLFALPIVYLFLSFFCIYIGIHLNFNNVCYWLAACLLGVALGWLQMLTRRVKAIKNEPKLYFPGSWALFIFVLALIAAKYYFGYELMHTITMQSLADPKTARIMMALFGLCAGLFLGRVFYVVRLMKTGPFLKEEYQF